MKRLMFLLCISGSFIYFSCNRIEPNAKKMASTDARAFLELVVTFEATGLGGTPPTAIAAGVVAAVWAAKISEDEGRSVANPNATQVKQNGIYIPSFTRIDIEINPFEEEGDLHNKAVDLIVRKGNPVDLYDKFMSRDRETMDEFFQLSPHLQDAGIREHALNAWENWEIPADFNERLTKISAAQNLSEAVSQLPLSENGKKIVTEVYTTCESYYLNSADFGQVAAYINGRIISLLSKGKDSTPEDQKLARMFTVFKHSYYYWHVN